LDLKPVDKQSYSHIPGPLCDSIKKTLKNEKINVKDVVLLNIVRDDESNITLIEKNSNVTPPRAADPRTRTLVCDPGSHSQPTATGGEKCVPD
jgi:hypothetical protein